MDVIKREKVQKMTNFTIRMALRGFKKVKNYGKMHSYPQVLYYWGQS